MPAPDETSRTDPCDSNFLEDIGNKMTIPRRLQVVSEPENVAESRTKMPMLQTGDCDGQHRLNANLMEVPDRIVLADGAKSRPKGLSWESFSAEGVLKEQLLLRTPPRVLTLQEQPLDYISLDPAPFHGTASKSEAAGRRMVSSRPRRRRSVSENGLLQSPSTQPYSSSLDLSANDSQLMDAMHGTEVDILTLHRQVLRLHQRLRATEHAQEKSARRDVLLCSAMAILLLINGWFWLRR